MSSGNVKQKVEVRNGLQRLVPKMRGRTAMENYIGMAITHIDNTPHSDPTRERISGFINGEIPIKTKCYNLSNYGRLIHQPDYTQRNFLVRIHRDDTETSELARVRKGQMDKAVFMIGAYDRNVGETAREFGDELFYKIYGTYGVFLKEALSSLDIRTLKRVPFSTGTELVVPISLANASIFELRDWSF